MMMEAIYFALRYTPWWAVPTLMISGRFAYVWWLKESRMVVIFCAGLMGLSTVALIYYIWAGSPSQAVYYFREAVHAIAN